MLVAILFKFKIQLRNGIFTGVIIILTRKNSKLDEAWSSFSSRAGSDRTYRRYSLSFFFFEKESNYLYRNREPSIAAHDYSLYSFFLDALPLVIAQDNCVLELPHVCSVIFFSKRKFICERKWDKSFVKLYFSVRFIIESEKVKLQFLL